LRRYAFSEYGGTVIDHTQALPETSIFAIVGYHSLHLSRTMWVLYQHYPRTAMVYIYQDKFKALSKICFDTESRRHSLQESTDVPLCRAVAG
jgi:hypothetical protein